MTYSELNIKANQVAHYLRAQGIGTQPDMLVGLGVERSFEMIIGILAILKAGGAYVPLDPTHPDDRLRYMLHDTKVSYVLTQAHLISRWESLSDAEYFFLPVALDKPMNYAHFSTENLDSVTQPNHLAYVIYTSGSTGQPKGVMLEQSNVINYLFNANEQFSDAKNVDFSSQLTFDLSVTTTLYPVCFGKTIFIFSGSLLEGDLFAQHLVKNNIELVKSTPALMRIIHPRSTEHYRLKYCIVGGEKLSSNSAESILQYSDHIIDEYGPTETTVGSTYFWITEKTISYSIGKNYHNYHSYVLDSQQQVLPIGAVGELYTGGAGLARGYLNRPELTEERFIWHRFDAQSEPVRLYKTGDLVRYLADGNLEYIGRADHQIKLRGFRIELGEIEAQLLKQAGISNAVVLVREEHGNKQLVAYVVSHEAIDILTLKTQLSVFLPEYMIPTHILHLEKMPLNVNGKVDRKALAALSLETVSHGRHLTPKTDTEKELAIIWAKILRLSVEKIGLQDNFFQYGGDSILAMQFVLQVRKEFLAKITVSQFYQSPTIATVVSGLHGDMITMQSSTIANIVPSLENEMDECIVPLSVSTGKPALFLIHPLYGTSIYYRRLVDSLSPHFSVYGVDYPNLMNGEMVYHQSLEILAYSYIQKIRKIFPNGPYHLGGYSIGGNLALEMSHQLQNIDQTVKTVLLLDANYAVFTELSKPIFRIIALETAFKTLNLGVSVDDAQTQRFISIASHLELLRLSYKPKILSKIDDLYLVKSQGSDIYRASQKFVGIDWRSLDTLNGMRHYFSEEQLIHVRDIPCGHHELLENKFIDLLNKTIELLLCEYSNMAYKITDATQQITMAGEKHAFYLQKGFCMEVEEFNENIQLLEIPDIEGQQQYFQLTKQSEQSLKELMQSHKFHVSHIKKLFQSMPYSKRFIGQIFQLMLDILSRHVLSAVLKIAQKLLIVRLASDISQNLICAFIFDDTYFSFFLQISQKLTFSLGNYLNIAFARNENFRVGAAFDAALFLGMVAIIPVGIYASLSQEIGKVIGLESALANTWRDVALLHTLAILPASINNCFESFYLTTYQYGFPMIGGALESAFILSSIFLFRYVYQFNGITLGLSLSIGSFAKALFYFLHFKYKNYISNYHLFQNIRFELIKQYIKESGINVSGSFVLFSYAILVSLLGAQAGTLNLTAYFVAKCCMDVINISSSLVTSVSNYISSGFISSSQFKNALSAGLIGIKTSLVASIFTSIPFFVLNGKMLSEFFINTDVISAADKSTFFNITKEFSFFFIGLGLINSVSLPLSSYLQQVFAYYELRRISIVCDILLTMGTFGILALSGIHDPTYYLYGLFLASVVAATWSLYAWLKIIDLYIFSENIQPAAISQQGLCDTDHSKIKYKAYQQDNIELAIFKPKSSFHSYADVSNNTTVFSRREPGKDTADGVELVERRCQVLEQTGSAGSETDEDRYSGNNEAIRFIQSPLW